MIKLGVLGSGAVLKWHILGIEGTEGARVSALAARNEETGGAACEQLGAKYYKTPAEMYENEKDLDGIINLMPNHLHYETCCEAIDAGCRFILCEKPLGIDLGQTKTLVEKAEAADTQLQVAYMKRFNPGFQKIKQAMDILGYIDFVNYTTVESGAANRISQRDSSSAWKTDPALSGGGNLTHVGSHVIDFLRFLFGDIDYVTCKLKRDTEEAPEYYANASLTFKNGVDADIRIGRVDVPNLGPDWEVYKGGWNEYLEVIGENGYIRVSNNSWEGLGPIRVTSWFKDEPGPKEEYFQSDLQWVNEIGSFVKGIENGALIPEATTARAALDVDTAVRKMRASDEEGGARVYLQD